jgi:murein DD-endopeptidase MepM/ murein hydrolase activator NlpD
MRSSTAAPTRLPGELLVIVLLAGSLILGPSPAGSAGEPDPVGVWPLSPAPQVVRRFDPPSAPWGSGHRGVDLRGRVGQTVRAALAGRVGFAGVLAGRGVVVVDHGATRTTYEPVRSTVAVGAVVVAGAAIGTLTADRSHCPPSTCLHWGWIRNADDVYLDPLLLVGAVHVRLLPLWRDRPVGEGAGTVLREVGAPATRPGAPPLVPPPALRPPSPYAGWRPLVELLTVRG